LSYEFEKPIPCPHCKQLLTTVQVERVTLLEFIEATEETAEDECYEDNGQGGVTIRCYKCGKEIGHSDAKNSSGICPKSDEF
jgi:phage FluMu protein Com